VDEIFLLFFSGTEEKNKIINKREGISLFQKGKSLSFLC
jgi:hypothetical protein